MRITSDTNRALPALAAKGSSSHTGGVPDPALPWAASAGGASAGSYAASSVTSLTPGTSVACTRLQPATVEEWAVALREPLKLAVIFTAFVLAIWLLVTAMNPVGLAPLLGWALWERPRKHSSGSG
jgi:hypothetical protein